jgi:hypothetical protein
MNVNKLGSRLNLVSSPFHFSSLFHPDSPGTVNLKETGKHNRNIDSPEQLPGASSDNREFGDAGLVVRRPPEPEGTDLMVQMNVERGNPGVKKERGVHSNLSLPILVLHLLLHVLLDTRPQNIRLSHRNFHREYRV